MYDIKNRQFIFKQSSGQVLNLFYDDKLGLCYSTLTKKNTWTEAESIQKNISPPFYADMDDNDRLNLLFQDRQGNLYLTRFQNGNLKTIPLLGSKSPSPYDKHLYMSPGRNIMNVFFVIQYNDKYMLSHQTITEDQAGAPKVIDYIVENDNPYSIVCDRIGNMFVFYQASDGKILQIGYKKYNSAQKIWTEFNSVSHSNGNCDSPKIISDNKNILHLCYQRRLDRQYELVYQQKIPDKNIWTSETVIFSSPYSFNNFSVVSSNGNTIVYWVRDDVIYYSTSTNEGNTFSKPVRYGILGGRQLMCMVYKTNKPAENDKIISNEIPGSYINGLRLAFYQGTQTMETNDLTGDDLKNMIVDGLKHLNSNIDELNEADDEIRNKLAVQISYSQNLEKELIKTNLNLNTIEEELKQLKKATNRLETSTNRSEKQNPEIDYDLLKGKLLDDLASIIQKPEIDFDLLKNSLLNDLTSEKYSENDYDLLKTRIFNDFYKDNLIQAILSDIKNIKKSKKHKHCRSVGLTDSYSIGGENDSQPALSDALSDSQDV